MRKLFLAASVAALAITAPALAKPDNKGGGNKGGGQPAKVERGGGGGGGGKAMRAERPQRAERGGGGREMRMAAAQPRGNDRAEQRGNRGPDRAEKRGGGRDQARAQQRQIQRQDRNEQRAMARGPDRKEQRVAQQRDRGNQRMAQQQQRGRDRDDVRINGNGRNADRIAVAGRDSDRVRFLDGDRFDGNWNERFATRGIPRGFYADCPPGLAKKNPPCIPPGQAKQMVGQALPAAFASQMLPLGLRDLYYDTDDYYWRYGNGYAYQVDRDQQLIRSVLPLIGAGLGIGMPFPYGSSGYQVPNYYQPFYQDDPYNYYRYSNGYVYEIDRSSGLIGDMIPLLDQGYGVGQMLPASYSYYNVPTQYRSWYPEDDDYYYRYAPGAIYQVDRDTSLITSIASLLTGGNGFAVGQQLPMGYDTYNVPYSYRSQYYDTPDSWYRYNNGYIYQVDPTTRLITSIISAIT